MPSVHSSPREGYTPPGCVFQGSRWPKADTDEHSGIGIGKESTSFVRESDVRLLRRVGSVRTCQIGKMNSESLDNIERMGQDTDALILASKLLAEELQALTERARKLVGQQVAILQALNRPLRKT